MADRYKLVMIFGVILVVLVLGVSSSYAYWTITKTQKGNNVIIGDCLNFTMESKNAGLTLEKAWPLIDFEGMQLEGYQFTVTNACPEPVDYRIELNSLVEENASYLSDEYIAVLLDYGHKEVLADLEELENTDTTIRSKRTIAYDTVMGNTTNTHTLRMWVDEDATNDEQNKSFLSKVSVSAGQGIEKYYTPEECFTFDSSNATITDYDLACGGTDVVIPYQFNIEGIDEPVAVTTIGSTALSADDSSGTNSLTSVEIPRTVKTIGSRSFIWNTKLEKIIMKDGLETLGYGAFAKNAANPGILSFVMIPETVKSISRSFENNAIENLIIPDSVTQLQGGFYNNKIMNLKIGTGIQVIQNDVFRKNEIKSLTIPNNIVTISGYAFAENKIENLIIPDSVEQILGAAFGFNPLKSIKFGTGLTTIGTGVFSNDYISSIPIGEYSGGTYLPSSMPNYLTEVVIPSNVVNIGDYAFYSMTAGTKIIVKNAAENVTLGTNWNGEASVTYEPETN